MELLVVLVLIGIASGLAGLALRQTDSARLEREAGRMAALLEAARAESRASGVPVRFELVQQPVDGAPPYRFLGLHPAHPLPSFWLEPGTTAHIEGANYLRLGPEPMVGPQRLVLRLGEQQLVLATDGLSPFAPQDNAAP